MLSPPAKSLHYIRCFLLATCLTSAVCTGKLNAQELIPAQPPAPELFGGGVVQNDAQNSGLEPSQPASDQTSSDPTRPGPSRIQPDFPDELILPPPSDAAMQKVNRFVEAQIDPEIPLPPFLAAPKFYVWPIPQLEFTFPMTKSSGLRSSINRRVVNWQ